MTTLAGWFPGDGVALIAVEVLWMIAALVALAGMADRVLARRRASLRSALWLSALVGVLLTPAFTLIGRQLPWHVVVFSDKTVTNNQPAERPIPREATIPPVRNDAFSEAEGAEPAPATETSESREAFPRGKQATPVLPRTDAQTSNLAPSTSLATEPSVAVAEKPPALPGNALHAFATLALLVWGLGSLWCSARFLHGWWRMHQLWRGLRPLDAQRWSDELTAVTRTLSVARLPEICLSADVHSPLVAGLLRPRVLLPERLPERTAARQFREILIHECAHVVRHDPLVHLLQRLAAALFWVHPLVHLLNRRLDLAREEVCDNHVLAHASAPDYAETLLTVAQICYPVPNLQGYLTMMPSHHNLERRITDLLEARRDKATRLPAVQRVVLVATLVLTLVAVSSIGLRGAAQAADDKGNGAPPAQVPPKELQRPGTAKTSPERAAVTEVPARPAPLRGTVLAPNGSPAAGAIVWAAKFTYSPLVYRQTVADERGQFAFSLDAGEWFVRARQGPRGCGGGNDSPTKIAVGELRRPVELRLEERGTFHGRLLDAETGKPISGGKLFLDAGYVLTTDANGGFTTGGLIRASHEAFVVAPGHARLRVLFDTTGKADTELETFVRRGGKIVGRVTDREGRPIPGAYVGRNTSGSYFSINGLYVPCDTQGRFEYDDAVTPGQPTWLTAFAPGFANEERRGVAISEDKPLELHFHLRPKPGDQLAPQTPGEQPRRDVSGVVRGPDGKPVAGVLVSWGYRTSSDEIAETRTDAAGRFFLTVPEGANILAVTARAFAPEFPHVEAKGRQKVDVILREGNSVRGRVVDDLGKPIADATVIAVTGSPAPGICNPCWLTEGMVRTDAEGRFKMKGIPNGAQFDILKGGLSDVRNQNLALNGADNTVKMLYGGAIHGRVVDRDGKPIRNFRVLVNAPRERKPDDKLGGFFAGYCGMGVRFTSDDGSFVLTGVGAESTYRISVLAEGHGEAVVDRAKALALNHLDGNPPLTLRAGPPVGLKVRAAGPDGKPVVGARITLVNSEPALDKNFSWGYHDASWEDMVRGRTDAVGQADFPALSFGGATVLVQAPGYARRRLGWRDGEKELKVQLEPEAVLAGEARNAAGEALQEFYVSLTGKGDQISASIGPDDKGRFRVAGLPAGVWDVAVRSNDGRSVLHQEKITLATGQTRDLSIVTKKE